MPSSLKFRYRQCVSEHGNVSFNQPWKTTAHPGFHFNPARLASVALRPPNLGCSVEYGAGRLLHGVHYTSSPEPNYFCLYNMGRKKERKLHGRTQCLQYVGANTATNKAT